MKVMVTGGTGFIGSAVCGHLVRDLGISVVNVDKLTYASSAGSTAAVAASPLYHFHKLDICNRRAMLKVMQDEAVDAVMHLAAESHVDRSINDPGEFMQTNILGTFSLLQAARTYFESLTPKKEKSFVSITFRPMRFSATCRLMPACLPRTRPMRRHRLIQRPRPLRIIW